MNIQRLALAPSNHPSPSFPPTHNPERYLDSAPHPVGATLVVARPIYALNHLPNRQPPPTVIPA